MGLLARLLKKRPEDQLRAMLGDYQLPTFPAIVLKARGLIRDEDSSNRDIGECIVQDPGLSVRVLKTINSASFGLRSRVDSVDQAIALLGRAQLESLLLSHGVGQALPKPRGGAFKAQPFWQGAARRASVASALAKRLHPATAGQSFTAALLQDMAVPVLADVLRDRYDGVLRASVEDEGDLGGLERSAFGWDHAEVGSWMCEAWSFPDVLTASIAVHHGSEIPEFEPPPAVRAVALLTDDPAANDVDQLVDFVEEAHGLDADEVRSIVERAEEDSFEFARLFA